ncbi:peptide deformylase, mitochondrial [Microcaecilia unicolor]|uniref:Peptide deformylase n=1 Tax=Microcaecilia unicolor TaxID=1415580 RepID=A0A6P7WX80_9AMPH|nr:peptide deformylase, mitochondrial-like [Microcaecilia unicolor]XP_030060511.1 peptide deformylase, mitochondrial [Microcaecilia unicolor]
MASGRIGTFLQHRLSHRLCKGLKPICYGLAALNRPWCCPLVADLVLVPYRTCISTSQEKQRTYWKYLKRKVLGPSVPPYKHVCQAGDPVLRTLAAPVEPSRILEPEIQTLIRTLVTVMRRSGSVGLSAPQVGVPLQVVAMEFPEKIYRENSVSVREAREMVPFPLTVFINPTMRVLDSHILSFPEGCESISGFLACVPRYRAVEISGLNEKGEAACWQVQGWPARIIQHEMDHLHGLLYVDKMDSKTFLKRNWMEVND